jgi:hypothetical protein
MKFFRKLANWDAFPKVEEAFLVRTTSGAWISVIVGGFLLLWILAEFAQYLTFIHIHQFVVDPIIRASVPVSIDITVNTPCIYLTLDLFDAAGNQVHVGNSVLKIQVGH